MAERNFLSRFIAFELQVFNDSIGIQLKNAVHLGKKFLAIIFSTIIYSHCSCAYLCNIFRRDKFLDNSIRHIQKVQKIVLIQLFLSFIADPILKMKGLITQLVH